MPSGFEARYTESCCGPTFSNWLLAPGVKVLVDF
jgi:hypothetical protein